MEKHLVFSEKDIDLVQEIISYQKENNLRTFIDAVRQLCSCGLAKNINVKINMN